MLWIMPKNKMICPHCHKPISFALVAAQMGRAGGLVKGPSKARDSEKMKAAANARWAKRKAV
jgi:hypothetical protein